MKKFSKTELVKQFPDNLYDITLVETEYPKHATKIAQQMIDKNVDAIISVGGEGTLHEIIQAVTHTDIKIGIIPNAPKLTVAYQLGIPVGIEKASRIIKNGHTRSVDIFEVRTDGQTFYAIAFIGIGYSAFLAQKMSILNNDLNTYKGTTHFKYMKNMLSEAIHFEPNEFHVSYNYVKKTIQPTEFIISNSKGYNAFIQYCPQASNNDGVMDVICFEDMTKIRLGIIALKGMFGVTEDLLDVAEYDKAEHIELYFEQPTDVHIDFEHYNFKGNVEISVLKQQVNIFAL